MSARRVSTISIFNHYTLPDHTVDLHGCQHLILTGPNGTGKTTALAALATEVFAFVQDHPRQSRAELESICQIWANQKLQAIASGDRVLEGRTQTNINSLKKQLDAYNVEASWTESDLPPAFAAYLPAHRQNAFQPPAGPKRPPSFDPKTNAKRSFTTDFLQLLVNQHTTLHMVRDKPEEVRSLTAELDRLRDGLRVLFDAPDLRFDFDPYAFAVSIRVEGLPMDWEHLAAGHHALMEIIAEIYTRSQATGVLGPLAPGVVLIDEPELHLHPELQERVLPGLTQLFPNVQFLVATHAAPVISSISNAWVHDLRNQEGRPSEQLQGRPYDSLLVSHFKVPTSYDLVTSDRVQSLLEAKQKAGTTKEKQALFKQIDPLLKTDDPRLWDLWRTLSSELGE